MKKLGAILLALLVIAGAGYYVLFLQMSDPDRSLYSIDLDEVRTLAGSLEGDLPVAINTEAPVTLEFPEAAVITGGGWNANPMVIYAYQVVYPDGHVMIDAAMSHEQAQGMGGEDIPFDDEVQARLQAALTSAEKIVFTHEHPDHIGGVIAHADAVGLLDRVRLTQKQISAPEAWGGMAYPDGALDGYAPLVYDDILALAPGIVLIEAAGHTPGSQIIFVRLQSGQEYLFIGDVAWSYAGIERVLPRPNVVSWAFLGEDRARTHAQVAELKELAAANPDLAIIVGHDGPRTRAQITAGLLGDRFQ
ncbi:MAG: MBL fold metallo-hydrolase [Rhodobiaceae bacterium]|nr:MAG: MBL fold metallo-hydrolase [Rhodobiaceae bacterium]